MWTFPSLKPGFQKRQSLGDTLLFQNLRGNTMHTLNQTIREVQKLKEKNGHTFCTCLQPQFTIRKQSSRSSGGSTDENMTTQWMMWTLIWCICLDATLRAAVDLGQDYEASLRHVKNHLWNSVGQLFNETGKLIGEQKEIIGVTIFFDKFSTWMSTRSLCGRAFQITNAKAYVFSDCVLCVWKNGR